MRKNFTEYVIRNLREAFYESRLLSELNFAECKVKSLADDDVTLLPYFMKCELCKCLLKQSHPYGIDFTVNYLKDSLVNFISKTEKELEKMGLSDGKYEEPEEVRIKGMEQFFRKVIK